MRKTLKIDPSTIVKFKPDEGTVILEMTFFDVVAVLQRIAEEGESVSDVNPQEREEELYE